MTYRVELRKTEEGYAVYCPQLPDCWAQGETEAEAVENIRTEIREYLAFLQASRDPALKKPVARKVNITVARVKEMRQGTQG